MPSFKNKHKQPEHGPIKYELPLIRIHVRFRGVNLSPRLHFPTAVWQSTDTWKLLYLFQRPTFALWVSRVEKGRGSPSLTLGRCVKLPQIRPGFMPSAQRTHHMKVEKKKKDPRFFQGAIHFQCLRDAFVRGTRPPPKM